MEISRQVEKYIIFYTDFMYWLNTRQLVLSSTIVIGAPDSFTVLWQKDFVRYFKLVEMQNYYLLLSE